MERIKNFADKLGSLIPGYKGYLERDGRRQCDKILREKISSDISSIEKKINNQISNAIEKNNKQLMRCLDSLLKRLNTLNSKVKFSSYGTSSFFSDNQIKEDELFEIYKKDLEIQNQIKALFEIINIQDLISINEKIDSIELILNDRNKYIKEYK